MEQHVQNPAGFALLLDRISAHIIRGSQVFQSLPFFPGKALHQPGILLPFSLLCWWDAFVERSEMLAGTQVESEGEEHREKQFSIDITYPTKFQHIWNRTSGVPTARDNVCSSSSYLKSQGQERDSTKAKTMGGFQVQYGFHYFILHRSWHCSLPDIKR